MLGRLYHHANVTVDKPVLVFSARISLSAMTTNQSICDRLRAIRTSKGFSLSDVERASNRTIRAVVLGSYERGDRSLSIKKALTIAQFYGVPLSYLLEEPQNSIISAYSAVIDLRKIGKLVKNLDKNELHSYEIRAISTFISGVVKHRNDYNGEVLSIRAIDISTLAMTLGKNPQELLQLLSDLDLVLNNR